MAAFVAVLALGGWSLGHAVPAGVLPVASGTAFAAVVLGQLANAFACRSESRWFGSRSWRSNPLLLWAVGTELVLLAVMLGWEPLASALGGRWPSGAGWALAASAIPAVLLADTAHKAVAGIHRRRGQA